MTSDRDALLERGAGAAPGGHHPPQQYGTAATGDAGRAGPDVRLTVDEQRAGLRVQDAALESLADGVGAVKNMAHLVHGEVVGQLRMLDGLVGGVEAAEQRTRSATQRASALERNPYSLYNFCLVLWPTVLLILLAFFGLKHWLLY
jgi:hypothetical protein